MELRYTRVVKERQGGWVTLARILPGCGPGAYDDVGRPWRRAAWPNGQTLAGPARSEG